MFSYWKTILWAIIIGLFLLLPRDAFPDGSFCNIEHLDKLVHFGLFFVLEFFALYDFRWNGKRSDYMIPLFTVLIGICYACFTEYFQMLFLAERSGDWMDLSADLIGLLAGLAFYTRLSRFINRFFHLKI